MFIYSVFPNVGGQRQMLKRMPKLLFLYPSNLKANYVTREPLLYLGPGKPRFCMASILSGSNLLKVGIDLIYNE